MKITIPMDVQELISDLEHNHHSAYIVGGCVRDAILGKTPHDYDLCTSAKPEEMKQSFSHRKIYDTGLKHGTITVAGKDDMYEVTTYRIDGDYTDNRHPEKVEFVGNVELDLARRDFTMNAIAYNNTVGLVDPFHGFDDIQNKIIRCVGNPDMRFQEDALRIMRAIRFAATYGFTIDDETDKAIHRNKNLLANISEERKNSEFCKMIVHADVNLLLKYKDVFAVFIPEIKPMFHFDQRTKWHQYDVYEHTAHAVAFAPQNDLIVRLTMFFHDIGKPSTFTFDGSGHFYGHPAVSTEITKKVMSRMRFDTATTNAVLELVENHDNVLYPSKKSVRKLLNKFGEEQTKRLITVHECDKNAQSHIPQVLEYQDTIDAVRSVLNDILQNKDCYRIRDLAINGNDLIQNGLHGIIIGKVLSYMLDEVMKDPSLNQKDILLKMIPDVVAAIEEKEMPHR